MSLLNEITFYLADKPAFLSLAFWGSLLLTTAILATLAYLVVFRISFLIARSRRRHVENQWAAVFKLLRKGEEPAQLPLLARGEKNLFLEFWLENRSLANPRFAVALDALAKRLALKNTIARILRPGKIEVLPSKVWLQGIAIAAVEYIDSDETEELLLEMTESDNIFLVAQACAMLAKLKVKGYEKKIIQTMFRFPANAPELFARVSQAGGSDVLHIMQPFLDRLPQHTIMNFISLAEQSNDDSLTNILLYRLQRTQSEEEIAALLRTLGRFTDERIRPAIVPFVQHPNTYVRIQATKALGRVGNQEDIELLKPLLSDPDWWMRYRAARAIVKLCKQDENFIEQLRESLSDSFARDILKHAYQELEWC